MEGLILEDREGTVIGNSARAAFERFAYLRKLSRQAHLSEHIVLTSLLCDTVVVLYQLIVSFFLRFWTPIRELGISNAMTLNDYAGYITFGSVSFIAILAYLQMYEARALLRFRYVTTRIIKAGVFWFIGFLSISLVFKVQPPISRVFVMIAAANVVVGLLAWRALFHRRLKRSSVAVNLRQRILFVGWNEETERLTRSFETDETPAYEVVGCAGCIGGEFDREPPDHIRTLGGYDEIMELIGSHSIDIVMLTDLNCSKNEALALANLCEKEMIQFKVIPSYFQILVSGLHLETIGGIPILGVTKLPLNDMLNVIAKRLVDIVGAIVGLTLSAPLIAIAGALVYLESPGPIFYRQRRLGQNGTIFQIIKIRSMRLDAEKNGACRAVKDDPRKLRIGSFLRRWNLDELPQFWNVLSGEMSLVGPRPEILELTVDLKEEIPHYSARHNIKPGMTGWAQIKGMRGDTDLCERIKCDLFYLENWSLMLDLQIMAMTFLRRDNAY